jgi:diketogulonate reductase-like aldo/keto reductase
VEAACRKTLSDLKLDYLDLYLMHWPLALIPSSDIIPKDEAGKILFDHVPVEVTWAAMEKLVEKGLVKNIGVSNFTVALLYNLLNGCKVRPVCNQVELHPFLQQQRLIDFCLKEKIAVAAYCPLARPGHPPRCPKDVDHDIAKHKVILPIARKHHKTPTQIVLRWHLQRAPNIVVLPKSTTASRIEENFKIFDFELDEGDMAAITTLDAHFSLNDLMSIFQIALFD